MYHFILGKELSGLKVNALIMFQSPGYITTNSDVITSKSSLIFTSKPFTQGGATFLEYPTIPVSTNFEIIDGVQSLEDL
jgi:hypothetical protein